MTTEAPRRRKHLRRLAVVLALLLILAGLVYWEQNRLSVEPVTLVSDRLPAAFSGFRLAQLSDLHGKVFGPDNARLLDALRAAQPDLIALTGDLVDREEQKPWALALARQLCAIAPTFYVTGNHEWSLGGVPAFLEALEAAGVTILDNRYVTLTRGGDTLLIAGIHDPNGYADQKTPAALAAEIAASPYRDCFRILLAHRDRVEEYAELGFDLFLCGHGHGGVVRIPFWDRAVLGTQRNLFPDYGGGLYPLSGGRYAFVSRGLGSNTTPVPALRLFNPPHLPVLTLSRP